MAIAPSKLGRFVVQEGFVWPTNELAASQGCGAADETLVHRLRETGLVRPEVTDDEAAETFRAARSEHAAAGGSPFNSPNERVRVLMAIQERKRSLVEVLEAMTVQLADRSLH